MPSPITRGSHRQTLERLIALAEKELWLTCPFIQRSTAEWLRDRLASRERVLALHVLTTHPLYEPSNDPNAVLLLLDLPACEVRCLRPLHAKVYIADRIAALVTSANLSRSGLDTIYECGVLLDAGQTLDTVADYIAAIWREAQPPDRDVLLKLSEAYGKLREPLGSGNGAVPSLGTIQTRRAECRYLAERRAFELILDWRSCDKRTVSGGAVMQFAKSLNADRRNGSDRVSLDRFGAQVVNINAPRWSKDPPLFAQWCTDFVFGDPGLTFEMFFKPSSPKPDAMSIGTVTTLLYLRRHGNMGREPEFCFYNEEFARRVGAKVKRPDVPTWGEYLAYCERCRDTLENTGLPTELWDLALSEMTT